MWWWRSRRKKVWPKQKQTTTISQRWPRTMKVQCTNCSFSATFIYVVLRVIGNKAVHSFKYEGVLSVFHFQSNWMLRCILHLYVNFHLHCSRREGGFSGASFVLSESVLALCLHVYNMPAKAHFGFVYDIGFVCFHSGISSHFIIQYSIFCFSFITNFSWM